MAPRENFGLSVSALKARLRENPCGAFAFWGPEELLKHFYLEKFQKLIEKEGSAEFNSVKLDFSRDHSLSDLLQEAQILPFGGEHRLVVCHGWNLMGLRKDELESLLELLRDLPPYLILIVYFENEEFSVSKSGGTGKILSALSPHMNFVSFPLQEERVLSSWAKKILEADGLSAAEKALRTLFRFSGNRMQNIRHELSKLSAYALSQGRKEVTEEDVILFCQDTTEFAVYHLCDAVLEGAVGAAERILSNLKKQEVEPVLITAAIARTLTGALLVLEGASPADCAKAAKLQPWQMDRTRKSLYGKTREGLEKAIFLCFELDGRLKGSRSDAFLVMETGVLQMASLMREGV
ncbi:MAG: DNA polymerase III subunit delta [Clostridia bacterium]|nr:DNA polymerase III subunit delta [Clostridia bacterium]